LGLEGNDLKEFIEQKMAEEREEITKRENQAREEKAQDRELRELELAHELEIRKLEVQALKESPPENHVSSAKTPKLPAFVDGKDDIDSYLRRFERFATTNKWNKSAWASNLSALLTGKALDDRLSDTDAVQYHQLKEALLKRYNLTEDDFRIKFR